MFMFIILNNVVFVKWKGGTLLVTDELKIFELVKAERRKYYKDW